MGQLLPLFGAAGLTILIELPILFAAGYRTARFLVVAALVNLASNLSLNLGLSLTGGAYWLVLPPAEILVVLIEWVVLAQVLTPRKPPVSLDPSDPPNPPNSPQPPPSDLPGSHPLPVDRSVPKLLSAPSARLLLFVALANLTSFSLGLLLMR